MEVPVQNHLSSPAIEPDLVLTQVDRISRSEGFRKSERLRRFLQFTVERTLRGDVWQLREHVIAREVFDRPADFDPRVESIVRVEAKRLRRKLGDYYTENGANDAVVIEFRTGSYVPEIRENQSRTLHRPRTADLTYGSPDGTAFARYLEAACDLNALTRKRTSVALESLLRLTAECPGFGLAHAALAEAYLVQAMVGSSHPLQALENARLAARRSLELEPSLAFGYAAMAQVHLFSDRDSDACVGLANKAIELMPHCVSAHIARGLSLMACHHESEGLAALQRAVELEPLSARANLALALGYDSMARPHDAQVWYQAAAAISPGGFTSVLWSIHALAQKNAPEAVRHMHDHHDDPASSLSLGVQGACAASAGDRKNALRFLGRVSEHFEGGYADPLSASIIHFALGDDTQAALRFQASLDQHSPAGRLTSLNPAFRAMLSRPRAA